tara:strand:+ start:81 stop:308 length:228 start_codon:yes stop_codon:yes gene_type:complete
MHQPHSYLQLVLPSDQLLHISVLTIDIPQLISYVEKIVFLAIEAASKKWTMPIRNWKPALNRFIIEFEEQLAPHI